MLKPNAIDKYVVTQAQIDILTKAIEEKGGWEADLLDQTTGEVNVHVDVKVWPEDAQAKMLLVIRDHLQRYVTWMGMGVL